MKIVSAKLFLIFVFLFTYCSSNNIKDVILTDEIYVASWNVENLFDTVDDPDKDDQWFLPNSEINWNEAKLEKKLANLARVFKYMNNGNGPDILGVEEVEHENLLYRLIEEFIKNDKYEIAYSESPDNRGIDNALIFNREIFDLEYSEPIRVNLSDNKNTRDILFVKLKLRSNNEVLNVFINHWPSRRGGLKETEKYRIRAAETLKNEINKLDISSKIIILGDFNDLPANISIANKLEAKPIDCNSSDTTGSNLYNLAFPLFKQGLGTYKYRDHWNMLDQIIISGTLINNKIVNYICNSFEILKPGFIIQKEGKYSGTSLPTFGGRKYLGGYSDHFPVGAKFKTNNSKNKSLSQSKIHSCLTNNKF